ncbi:hypothetical protein RGU12_16085 [Fredinandcohnia sp. QZ13]|uniref:hypothetical protein n=1 Tax=Fredinandcohnia sp. QZ13 TaxID=3073144 RepID=UPI0028534C4D|nr:hypothetical protein [Fredinandcohnia sp. QZ13]MDR4889031.1 hypothetical protein [Fredinandcohnia sp. QZ13]
MNLFIYLMMTILFAYTTGFSISLWKDKNKPGSIVVFGLALVVAVAPFFTILK